MIALDTNIVVRLITEDDPRQVARARAMILARTALVQVSVLVESEWVLRSVYRYSRGRIAEAFAVLADTDPLIIENSRRFHDILEAYAGGMDFADAVHVAGSEAAEAFVTFDKSLVAGAQRYFPDRTVLTP